MTLEATAGGQMMRLTEDLKSALDGDGTLGVLDGRRVQAFMTGMIAREWARRSRPRSPRPHLAARPHRQGGVRCGPALPAAEIGPYSFRM